MESKKLRAFVVMPFVAAKSQRGSYTDMGVDDLDTVFSMISDSISNIYAVKRSESATDILREIILELDQAELVIVDLTALNPNVMYELGIRHAFCKKTIIITQDRAELPFDLKSYYTIEYKWKTTKDKQKFMNDIIATLEKIGMSTDNRYGPVHTHLASKALGLSDFHQDEILQRLSALKTELGWYMSSLDMASDRLVKQYPSAVEKSQTGIKFIAKHQTKDLARAVSNVVSTRPSLPCVDLFISEGYVPKKFDINGELTHFVHMLLTLRNIEYYGDQYENLVNINRLSRQCFSYCLRLDAAVESGLATDKWSQKNLDELSTTLDNLNTSIINEKVRNIDVKT